MSTEEKRALEGEVVRKCLARGSQECNVVDHRGFKVVYRRYASLFFLLGVDDEEVGFQGRGGKQMVGCTARGRRRP